RKRWSESNDSAFSWSGGEMQILRSPGPDAGGVALGAAQADVAVGSDEIEGRPGNPSARQLFVVLGIGGNRMHADQVSKPHTPFRRRRLSDQNQVEMQIAESLKQIFEHAVSGKPDRKPRKTVAGFRGRVRQRIQGF